MSKLIITVPVTEASDYLEHVVEQIRSGCTSGHVDAARNWDLVVDGDESGYDLA